MKDITPDICDQHEDKVTLLNLPLQNFGQKAMVKAKCWLWMGMVPAKKHYLAIN